MANTDAPNGFTPAYHLYGGVIRPQKLRIESGTSAAIFSGDVVNLSSGYVIQGTATGTPAGVFAGAQRPEHPPGVLARREPSGGRSPVPHPRRHRGRVSRSGRLKNPL